ncbi:MAG: hypothetical protein ACREYA_11715 [Cupriavidus necator]
MRKLFFILAIAPALVHAELIVLNPKPTSASAPPVASAVAPLAPIVMSKALQMTVVREGDSLVLMFRDAPASLFITNVRTGAAVSDADWLSDKSLRVRAGARSELEIRTPRGRAVLQLDAIGVALHSEGAGSV